jgi:hypothetical protein
MGSQHVDMLGQMIDVPVFADYANPTPVLVHPDDLRRPSFEGKLASVQNVAIQDVDQRSYGMNVGALVSH